MRITLIVLLSVFVLACNTTPKNQNSIVETKDEYVIDSNAMALNDQAMKLHIFGPNDSLLLDSAIYLLDKATNMDSNYFIAYSNKIMYLFMKGDWDRALETNRKIRDLQPGVPNWIMREGWINEMLGKTSQANYYYKEGVISFEELLSDSSKYHWTIEFDYAHALVFVDQYEQGEMVIEKLQKQYPNELTLIGYELPKKELILTIAVGK